MTGAELLRFCDQLLRMYGVRGSTARAIAVGLAVGDPLYLPVNGVLCEAGSPSDSLFILLQGTICVERPDSTGTPQTLAMLPAPQIIGQVGLVDRTPRSARCVAQVQSFVIEIDRRVMDVLLARLDEVGSSYRRLIAGSVARLLSSDHVRRSEEVEEADLPDLSQDLQAVGAVVAGWNKAAPMESYFDD